MTGDRDQISCCVVFCVVAGAVFLFSPLSISISVLKSQQNSNISGEYFFALPRTAVWSFIRFVAFTIFFFLPVLMVFSSLHPPVATGGNQKWYARNWYWTIARLNYGNIRPYEICLMGPYMYVHVHERRGAPAIVSSADTDNRINESDAMESCLLSITYSHKKYHKLIDDE